MLLRRLVFTPTEQPTTHPNRKHAVRRIEEDLPTGNPPETLPLPLTPSSLVADTWNCSSEHTFASVSLVMTCDVSLLARVKVLMFV